MELFYKTQKDEPMNWPVAEVIAGQSYRIVDSKEQPNPQRVEHTEGRSISIVFFDGFIVEDNKIYATALHTRNPKIEVGHSPIIG